MAYEMSATKIIEDSIEADEPRIAARLFYDKHGVLPVEVDGADVIGICEACGVVILAGDAYGWGEDCVMHDACADEKGVFVI